MPHEMETIYTAESLHDAQQVRDLLAAAGVAAVLMRDPFEPGQAAGAEEVRVQVSTADAEAARPVVGRFTRSRLGESAESGILDTWPRCPECNTPRIACCPVCQTAGYDFPQADFEFSVPPEYADASEPLPCDCGVCDPNRPADAAAGAESDADASHTEAEEVEPPVMLTCPTCDEPFIPRYLKRCEWCGHAFPDGAEFELPEEPAEQLNARVVAVFFALAAGAMLLLAWLAYAI